MSYAWIFAAFTAAPPIKAQWVWVVLPVLVLIAICVIVHCIGTGDEEETAALRDPIDTKE